MAEQLINEDTICTLKWICSPTEWGASHETMIDTLIP